MALGRANKSATVSLKYDSANTLWGGTLLICFLINEDSRVFSVFMIVVHVHCYNMPF